MTDADIIDALRAMLVERDGELRPAYSPESLHMDAEDLLLAALEGRGGGKVAAEFRRLRNTPNVFWYS